MASCLGIAAAALIGSGCGPDLIVGAASPATAAADVPAIEVPAAPAPPPAPPLPLRTWIGKTRSQIESEHLADATGQDAGDGWVRYPDGVRVRYDSNIVVGLAARAPAGLGCHEAAKWMGFPTASPPVSANGVCEWPNTASHRIGHGHTGRMDPSTRIIEIQLGS